MAWKPWYEQLAEMNNESEKKEFMRGVFGYKSMNNAPIIIGLVAGYFGAKSSIRKQK